MKRKLFLSLILIIGITLLFGGTTRVYVQRCSLADGSEAPVTNTGATTSPDYIVRATMIGPATGPETLGTDMYLPGTTIPTPPTTLRISRLGTGTDIPYYTGTSLQLGSFPTQHQPGWTIHMYVKYIPTQEVAEWDLVIPPGTNTINIQSPVQVIPPYPVIQQVLTITSDPTGQPIWINGVDSGFITPHDFNNPTVGDIYTINNPAYTWNPPSYTVPEEFTTTTINFVGTPVIVDTWALTVNSTPAGIEIIKDGNPTGQVTPYTFTSSTAVTDLTGVYSLATTTLTGGQFWDPATITVTAEDFVAVPAGKGANLKVAAFGSKNGPKTNYAYSISFQMKTCYTLTITGPTEAGTVGASAVTGPAGTVVGNIPVTLVDNNDNINDLVGTYTIAALPTDLASFTAAGLQYRKHWIENPKTVDNTMFENDVATLAFQWRDYLARWDVPAVPGMPDAHLFFVPVATPQTPVDYGILPITLYYYGTKDNYGEWKSPDEGNYYAAPEDFNPAEPPAPPLNNPGPSGGDKQSYTLTILAKDASDVPMNVGITINDVYPSTAPVTPYDCVDPTAGTVFSIYDPTHLYTWVPADYTVPVGGLTDNTTITFTLSPYSPPLPVELTSFTAVLTSDMYVQLNWVSQSETNLSGYRIYRNEQNYQQGAILITPEMIPAYNTSQAHSYIYTDTEIENHTTYYYWLESVEFNDSQFHGPVIVTVEGNVPPVLPEVTTLKSAYPNPFRANSSTNIEVSIKQGETGTLTIYNIMGQVVRTYKVSEGIHNINWNGRDSQGNICGSGIYFYKLTTPSLNQTKKMVIVK